MSLIPRRLSERLLDMPLSQFPSLWQDFDTNLQALTGEMPGLTVYEDKKSNNFVVEAEMPGFKADEIEVNLNRGILWIKAEKHEEESDKEKSFYRKASSTRSYRYALPEQIDEKQELKAVYKDGIIKITFQKAKTAETKKIPVKAESK